MPYPGSLTQLQLTVDPFDGTTAVTVSVAPPDGGTALTPSATSTDGGHTWTATLPLTKPGKWAAQWLVANTGAGVVFEDVWVSEPATVVEALAWRPELWQVADYIPGRTLVGAVDGYGNALNTFDQTTHPTGDQVQRLITAACAWVTLKTGPVDSTLNAAAADVAAMRTAGLIEQGYPDNRDDLNTAAALLAQAAAARDDLWKANEAATGQDPEDPEAHLLPVYSFPPPYDPLPLLGGDYDGAGGFGPPYEIW